MCVLAAGFRFSDCGYEIFAALRSVTLMRLAVKYCDDSGECV